MAWTVTLINPEAEQKSSYAASIDNEFKPIKLQNSATPKTIQPFTFNGDVRVCPDFAADRDNKQYAPYELLFNKDELDTQNEVVQSDVFNNNVKTANGVQIFKPEYKISDMRTVAKGAAIPFLDTPVNGPYVKAESYVRVELQSCGGSLENNADYATRNNVDLHITSGEPRTLGEHSGNLSIAKGTLSKNAQSTHYGDFYTPNGDKIDSKTKFWNIAWPLGYLNRKECDGGCGVISDYLPIDIPATPTTPQRTLYPETIYVTISIDAPSDPNADWSVNIPKESVNFSTTVDALECNAFIQAGYTESSLAVDYNGTNCGLVFGATSNTYMDGTPGVVFLSLTTERFAGYGTYNLQGKWVARQDFAWFDDPEDGGGSVVIGEIPMTGTITIIEPEV